MPTVPIIDMDEFRPTKRGILRAVRDIPGVRLAWINEEPFCARLHVTWSQVTAGAGVSASWKLRDLLDRVVPAGVWWSAQVYPEDGSPTISFAKQGPMQHVVKLSGDGIVSLLFRPGTVVRMGEFRRSLWRRLTWWRHPPDRVVDVDHIGSRVLLHRQRWSWTRWSWRDA